MEVDKTGGSQASGRESNRCENSVPTNTLNKDIKYELLLEGSPGNNNDSYFVGIVTPDIDNGS